MRQTVLLFYLYFLSNSCIYAFDQAAIPAKPFFNNASYPTARLKLLLTLDYDINRTEILSLLGHKADPNVTEGDVSGLILHKAVRRNDFDVVEKALAGGADPNVIDETGSSLLMHTECPRIAQCLLDAKANPAFVNKDGENHLHTAVHKSFELMAILCNAQVDPNKRDTIRGNTPIHRLFSRSIMVSDFGKKAAALLLAGGDPTIKNYLGKTPLEVANIGHITVAEAMIKACPSVKKEREEYYKHMTHYLNERFPKPITQLALTYVGQQPVDDTCWPLFEKRMSHLPQIIVKSLNVS